MTTTKRTGLDLDIPRSGRAADAYEVAGTAMLLMAREIRTARSSSDASANHANGGSSYAARHATALHVISGKLHRIAERQCNGYRDEASRARDKAKQLRLERYATEIAGHYGLFCSFGGLVDGGLVIGSPEQLDRVDPERHGHVIRRLGQ